MDSTNRLRPSHTQLEHMIKTRCAPMKQETVGAHRPFTNEVISVVQAVQRGGSPTVLITMPTGDAAEKLKATLGVDSLDAPGQPTP